MSTTKYFPKTFDLLRRIDLTPKKEKENVFKNELIHPRFEVDPLAQKSVPNSLLFLMYSQENEALFI